MKTMFRVVDNQFLGLLLTPCVEAGHVKNTTVFTGFTASNNDLTNRRWTAFDCSDVRLECQSGHAYS